MIYFTFIWVDLRRNFNTIVSGQLAQFTVSVLISLISMSVWFVMSIKVRQSVGYPPSLLFKHLTIAHNDKLINGQHSMAGD